MKAINVVSSKGASDLLGCSLTSFYRHHRNRLKKFQIKQGATIFYRLDAVKKYAVDIQNALNVMDESVLLEQSA